MKTSNYFSYTLTLWRRVSHLYLVIMLLLLVTAISCSDEEPGQAPLDIGVPSASSQNVVLNFDTPTQEAITFSWHAEKTPTIQYQLVFAANAKSDTVEVLSEVSRKFNHAELNKIMVDGLQLEIGKAAHVDVLVHGKVTSGSKTGSSNPITIIVTPSPKVAEPPLDNVTLTVSKSDIVIDIANPSGETATLSWATERNIFIEYKITLTAGSKTATVDALSAVSKEFTNEELNDILIDELRLATGKATSVNVQVTGKVTISGKTVSSNTMVVSATPADKNIAPPAYTHLWIVGKATPNDWNIDDPNVMVADPINIYQFKYNEMLIAGEFKIPVTKGNWQADYYMPPVNHPDLSSTAVQLIPKGNPDNKWNITNPGAYKILLNIGASPFIKITPFIPADNLYILGDATTAGWDANNPIAMTQDSNDPNIFTWTGELKSTGRGQFRFPLSTGDSNQSFYGAPSSGAAITSTQLSFTPTGSPANNFKVNEGEDGIYKITINQLKETIEIVKQ